MDIEEAIRLCTCRICSSFKDCGESIAYCLTDTGHSACIQKEMGCLCPGCPVLEEEDFSHVYFCTRGNEALQQSRG